MALAMRDCVEAAALLHEIRDFPGEYGKVATDPGCEALVTDVGTLLL